MIDGSANIDMSFKWLLIKLQELHEIYLSVTLRICFPESFLEIKNLKFKNLEKK